jgi:stearoyl-CoA desaturase (delta-9 desaturase)
VSDLVKFPELRWLGRYWLVPPVIVAIVTYALGGYFGLVWGFFVSQAALWHGTFTINSLSHVIGWRRFDTTDDSRNHWALALLTLGEGWHNNHHHRPGVARQGIGAKEIDISFAILRVLAAVGLVWDLRDKPVTKVAISKGAAKAKAVADTTPGPLAPPVDVVPRPINESTVSL